MYPLQNRFFVNALYGEDQLRQRVAFALHQIIVVSGAEIRQTKRTRGQAPRLPRPPLDRDLASFSFDIQIDKGVFHWHG